MWIEHARHGDGRRFRDAQLRVKNRCGDERVDVERAKKFLNFRVVSSFFFGFGDQFTVREKTAVGPSPLSGLLSFCACVRLRGSRFQESDTPCHVIVRVDQEEPDALLESLWVMDW